MASFKNNQMSPRKWRQVIEEVKIRWQVEPEHLQHVATPGEIITLLHKTLGASWNCAEREIQGLIREFEEKVRRAA